MLSLFSGAGGLDLGFEEVGFLPLLALDDDPAAVQTYNHNRRHRGVVARVVDLAKTRPSTVLGLWRKTAGSHRPIGIVGGPPCQAFSTSNVHKNAGDPRAHLLRSYTRLLKAFHDEYQLDFFVFENVVGLLRPPHLHALAELLQSCGDAGFAVREPFLLDAVRFGVPQHRKRLFVVGFNQDRFAVEGFRPPPGGDGSLRTVRSALEGLVEPAVFGRGVEPAELGLHPNHWCMNPRSQKFNRALEAGDQRGRSFRVLEWDRPSWTVAYGHREVHVHPSGRRRLSVFEAMRLQGFPSSYELRGTLSDQYRLVSDAVPPPLAHALAHSVRAAIHHQVTTNRSPTKPNARVRAVASTAGSAAPTQATPSSIASVLINWYPVHARNFPWRVKGNALYRVLVAEILLKKTAAPSVVPVYVEFLRRYATSAALARAQKSELVRLLQPVGLSKQRADHLKRLGRALVEARAEPMTSEELSLLPGIGRYSAALAAAVCFGEPRVGVDTNIARVLSRLFGITGSKSENRKSPEFWDRASALALAAGHSTAELNWALLDLGASLCRPRNPLCTECPLQQCCGIGRTFPGGGRTEGEGS